VRILMCNGIATDAAHIQHQQPRGRHVVAKLSTRSIYTDLTGELACWRHTCSPTAVPVSGSRF
jgi:hypothetical protein